jgi:hypothetical protein
MEVQIKFTYNYSVDLLKVYHELLNCEFVGRYTRPVSYQEAEIKLKELLKSRFLDSTQMAVMEIYYNGQLVGMSLPRHTYTQQEKELFVVDNSYYKIGKIIILKEFRGKGIAKIACKQFLNVYHKVMYHTAANNEISLKLVQQLGISYSHVVELDGITFKVFKTG